MLGRSAAFLSTFVAAAIPAAAEAQHLTLGPDSGQIVEAVVNGVTLRLKVQLDHELAITVNPEAAERAKIGGTGRAVMQIGPVRLVGRRAQVPLVIAGQDVRASVQWFDRPVRGGADGTISVHVLPFESVTLERASAAEASRTLQFDTRVEAGHGIFVPLRAGGRNIAVRFSLDRSETVALAAAASAIGRDHGGELDEANTLVPVAFGVTRPARLLRLGRPLRLGALTLPAMLVRAGDFRGGNRLPPTAYDGSEAAIVVTGAAESQDSVYRITIGSDLIGGCPSLTYSRASRRLTLRCF